MYNLPVEEHHNNCLVFLNLQSCLEDTMLGLKLALLNLL